MSTFIRLARTISTLTLTLAIAATILYMLEAKTFDVFGVLKGFNSNLQYVASGLLLQLSGLCLLLRKKSWALLLLCLGAFFAIRSPIA